MRVYFGRDKPGLGLSSIAPPNGSEIQVGIMAEGIEKVKGFLYIDLTRK